MDLSIFSPDTLVRDCITSLATLYPDQYLVPVPSYNGRTLLRNPLESDRVNIIVSNGGGAYPLSAGYVADGLADASANGNLRAAPSAYDIYEAAKYIGSQKGYLLIYNNFMGDYLNNDMAVELLNLDGIPARLCPCTDDCLSVPKDAPRTERTGLVGLLYLIKIGASCAHMGLNLDEIYSILRHANERLSTLTVTFDFTHNLVCLGAGFSGEPPVLTFPDRFHSSDAASIVYDTLIEDLNPQPGEKLYLLISILDQTKKEEAFVFAHEMCKYASVHIPIAKVYSGHYITLLNDHGFFVSILCADQTLEAHLSHTIVTEAFHF